jgi:hypothetical protein
MTRMENSEMRFWRRIFMGKPMDDDALFHIAR